MNFIKRRGKREKPLLLVPLDIHSYRDGLFVKIIVAKGNSRLAGEINQRDAKRNQRSYEQERHAIFVCHAVERANEGDNDNERGKYRRYDGAEQRSIYKEPPGA